MHRSRKTILAVDDFAGVTEMLGALLSRYEVERAERATQALRMAERRGYDLYLVDFALPDMGGPTFCRAIRQLDSNAPLLIYSALPEPCDGDAPWTVWLEKSIDPADIAAQVDVLLHQQMLLNESAEAVELAAVAAQLAERDAALGARMAAVSSRVEDSARRLRASWASHCRRDDIRRAFQVYANAGGTRASFEHYWADLLGERAGQAAASTAEPA